MSSCVGQTCPAAIVSFVVSRRCLHSRQWQHVPYGEALRYLQGAAADQQAAQAHGPREGSLMMPQSGSRPPKLWFPHRKTFPPCISLPCHGVQCKGGYLLRHAATFLRFTFDSRSGSSLHMETAVFPLLSWRNNCRLHLLNVIVRSLEGNSRTLGLASFNILWPQLAEYPRQPPSCACLRVDTLPVQHMSERCDLCCGTGAGRPVASRSAKRDSARASHDKAKEPHRIISPRMPPGHRPARCGNCCFVDGPFARHGNLHDTPAELFADSVKAGRGQRRNSKTSRASDKVDVILLSMLCRFRFAEARQLEPFLGNGFAHIVFKNPGCQYCLRDQQFPVSCRTLHCQ